MALAICSKIASDWILGSYSSINQSIFSRPLSRLCYSVTSVCLSVVCHLSVCDVMCCG